MISSAAGEMAEVGINQTTRSRISVVTSREYLAPPPAHAKVFADGQEFVVADPLHVRWPDASKVMADAMNEELWTNRSTAAQVARKIKESADPLLK